MGFVAFKPYLTPSLYAKGSDRKSVGGREEGIIHDAAGLKGEMRRGHEEVMLDVEDTNGCTEDDLNDFH